MCILVGVAMPEGLTLIPALVLALMGAAASPENIYWEILINDAPHHQPPESTFSPFWSQTFKKSLFRSLPDYTYNTTGTSPTTQNEKRICKNRLEKSQMNHTTTNKTAANSRVGK